MSRALDLMAALVLEDGRRWGQAAVPVQWEDARAVLDERSGTPYHWLSRSRGFSKTSDLAGMAIAALLTQAPARARAYGLASDMPQSGLLLDALAGFVSRTPELQGALKVQELRVIATRSGATLEVLPSDSASIWGKRPYFAVVDEISQWHDTPRVQRVYEGLTSAMPKVEGSRLVCLATAGDPSHFSYGIRGAVLESPLWRVSEIEGPAPWLDPVRLEEERRRLPESSYLRLFENVWTSGEDRLAADEDLVACIDPDAAHSEPRGGTRYVLSVDLGVRHDSTACVVAHAERVPGSETLRVVVDRLQVWTPTRLRPVRLKDVEGWIRSQARRWRATVYFDPAHSLQMQQSLKRDGIPVKEWIFSATSVGKLAGTLVQLIRERALALPPDEALLDELRNVRLKETSVGIVRLDHARGKHDDRAIALGIAAHVLVERGVSTPGLRGVSVYATRRRAFERSLAAHRRDARLEAGVPAEIVDDRKAMQEWYVTLNHERERRRLTGERTAA